MALPVLEDYRGTDRPGPDLAAAREKIVNLEIALRSARRIGCAVGIIMATYQVTDDEAFALLVMASQRKHRKLREVAQDVTDTGELRWGPGQDR